MSIDWIAIRHDKFFLQLPYLNTEGIPMVVQINNHDAEMLVSRRKTHKLSSDVGDNIHAVVPIVTAEQRVTFQKGEKPV